MSSPEKRAYYNATMDRDVRSDLVFATGLVSENKVAIDCGCGAGSDIAYLRERDFTVHAFDIEKDAIAICEERFGDDPCVHLTRAGFCEFEYPDASLIVADASLFFCPVTEFERVWASINNALTPGGIFCGSFLGPKDTMASQEYEKEAFWPDVMVCNEAQTRAFFSDFKILKWTEHRSTGKTAGGKPHNWHIFTVVAQSIR